ncbi:sigma-70 family RNA polymerase sigma factor [Duganella sp. LX47W]|uniref:RNA polymerase sigma factor n=1 Tax=Rugamonas apoptosis TaxID=2758570 RepID=A0A7W2F6E8_9BURK|nr:sigma-70 family RNA polymerase sigma factor [Rugamonas apoptosis]
MWRPAGWQKCDIFVSIPPPAQRPAVSSAAQAPDPVQLRRWLQDAAHGDAQAFRALYDATSAKLFGFALRILHKRELAEDVLQESFVAIWHNAASYQSQLAAPMTWLTTIVRNKAFDLLRRSDATVEIDSDPFATDVMNALQDPHATPPDVLQLSSEARALARCLAALEGMQRQAIGLAYFHDLSHSEVAHQLALPVGTVKTWIRRGLERLRRCLAQRERT